MTVETEAGTWTVPPARGVWIPARVQHQLIARTRVQLRTVYLRRGLRDLPTQLRVIDITPLMREIVLRVAANNEPGGRRAERLARVLIDELSGAGRASIELPTPRAALALAAADRLRTDPAVSIDALAAHLATSRRTLERRFAEDLGMGLGEWRQRAQLVRGIELLAEGHSVTAVALAVGYSTPSGLINAFRRRLGTTPGHYFAESTTPLGPSWSRPWGWAS